MYRPNVRIDYSEVVAHQLTRKPIEVTMTNDDAGFLIRLIALVLVAGGCLWWVVLA